LQVLKMGNNKGEYQKTLLEREEEVFIPGINLGNSSQILFFPDDNYMLHFNYFTGVFKKISKTGKAERIFSVFDSFLRKEISNIKEDIKERRKKSKPNSVSTQSFQLWSDCCIDENSNIIVFLLLKKKEEHQKMFVFSSEGDFLYWKWFPYIEKSRIDNISYFNDLFIFKTSNDGVFLSKVKEGKNEKK